MCRDQNVELYVTINIWWCSADPDVVGRVWCNQCKKQETESKVSQSSEGSPRKNRSSLLNSSPSTLSSVRHLRHPQEANLHMNNAHRGSERWLYSMRIKPPHFRRAPTNSWARVNRGGTVGTMGNDPGTMEKDPRQRFRKGQQQRTNFDRVRREHFDRVKGR